MALYLGLTIMRKCWTLQGLTEILPYVFHRQDGLCFHVKEFLKALISYILFLVIVTPLRKKNIKFSRY